MLFERAKAIPFPEVLRTFLPSAEPRKNKIHCPFHDERTPSLHVYRDGFFCYGCGQGGSNIDFVAKLQGITPAEAARVIAKDFGLSVVDKPSPQVEAVLRNKRLEKAFRAWEESAFKEVMQLVDLLREVLPWEILIKEKTPITPLLHKLPLLEYWAEILAIGTDEEKIELWRIKKDGRWFNG